MEQLSEDFVFSCIQLRAQESHKGSYGHVLLAAGSRRYRGAANLAAEGALRSGAGIVTLAAIEPVIAAAAARLPECCLLPCPEGADGGISAGAAAELLAAREKAGVLLMGPGMGNTSDTRALVRALVDGAACTVVLDADGLNAAAALLAAGEALPRPGGQPDFDPSPGGDGPPDRPAGAGDRGRPARRGRAVRPGLGLHHCAQRAPHHRGCARRPPVAERHRQRRPCPGRQRGTCWPA